MTRAIHGTVAALAVAGLIGACGGPRGDGAELRPLDAFDAVIEATGSYPLVALGEFHQMQEWHDFMAALLLRREFTDNVDDIVIEFGNALYQDVADRFVVELEPVGIDELSQIWRNAGSVLWDAPVYEQFFRNVRAVNEQLPSERRVRILLGGPDVDYGAVRSAADTHELMKGDRGDAFFADVVEREVIAGGRRALLISGADHLRRGVHANTGPDDPNVATLLEREHPGQLFIVYPLPYEYDAELGHEIEDVLASWPGPTVAHVDDTWLGVQRVSHRVLDPDSTFEDQVDAVLWLGSRESLTASRADPAIYRQGDYAVELERRSAILSAYFDETIDYVDEGLRLATAGPRLVADPPRE
ncbi:MAG: hypothetical protein ACRDWI_13135 [Jiangellaceae bacterium]